ncbi:MAG: hypothetical protein LBH18_00425 [Spirochaetaceae bacterium]|jgi:hypothetical protein|nr:hypothetical protein [Spirochaetaceae bacterium]
MKMRIAWRAAWLDCFTDEGFDSREIGAAFRARDDGTAEKPVRTKKAARCLSKTAGGFAYY